jgi:cytochrome b
VKNERVWDPLVRLFHWSLVAAFATAWWGRGEAVIHETAGNVVIGLIIFRAVWGLIGPGSARFENFIAGPKATLVYVIAILRGKPAHYIGHNPAGAAMIGLMLLTIAATAASGVLMTTTALWGNAWIEWIHGTSAYLMLFLIAGHLLGILAAAIQHRENLVWSMITGWKWVPEDTLPYLGNLKLTLRRSAQALLVVLLGIGIWTGSTTLLNASVWRLHKTFSASLTKAGCETAKVNGPRIEVHPALGFHYDIDLGNGRAMLVKSVSATHAFQRRPDIALDDLTRHCAKALESAEVKQVQIGGPPVEQVAATKPASDLALVEAAKTLSTFQIVRMPPARSAVELAMAQSTINRLELTPQATSQPRPVKAIPPPAKELSAKRVAVKKSTIVAKTDSGPQKFISRKVEQRRKFIKAKIKKQKIRKRKVRRAVRARFRNDGEGGQRSPVHGEGDDRDGGGGNRGRGGGGDGGGKD